MFHSKTKASIIGNSESKLDSCIPNSELNTDDYDLIRLDCSRRGDGVACYVRKSLSYNYKTSFCRSTDSIFLPESKPMLVGVIYQPPDKPDFIEHLSNY